MVGYYFEERRSLASGIACSGAGIGMLILAPTSSALLRVFDWKNSLVLLSAFPLQVIICGALMRPHEKAPSFKQNDSHPHSPRKKVVRDNKESRTCPDNQLGKPPGLKAGRRLLDDVSSAVHSSLPSLAPKLKTESSRDISSPETDLLKPDSEPRRRLQTFSGHDHNAHIARARGKVAPESRYLKVGPMLRKDIFYSGSIHQLAEYRTQADRESYISSILINDPENTKARDAVMSSLAETESPKSSLCIKVMVPLKEMMDFAILRNPYFLVICLAQCCLQIAYFIPIVFLPNYAIAQGIDEGKAALLISVFGKKVISKSENIREFKINNDH